MRNDYSFIPNAFLAITGSDSRGSPAPNLFTPLTRKTYSPPLTNFWTETMRSCIWSETVDHTTLLVSRFSTI